MKRLRRREFLHATAAGAAAAALAGCGLRRDRANWAQRTEVVPIAGGQAYQRADIGIIAGRGYGVGFHWLPYTWSRKYPPFDWANKRRESIRNYHKAAEAFDVKYFVEQVRRTGAGHVLFTPGQAYGIMCCPNEALDRVCPGLTSKRDLLGEIADELVRYDIKLMLYYCRGMRNREWMARAGWNEKDKRRFFNHVMDIWACCGERYGEKLVGWWFDHGKGYRVADRAFGANVGWAKLAKAAKAGFAGRLITYNGGVENFNPVTQYQDMWAGELTCMNYVPRGTLAGNLPWYSFATWHAGAQGKIAGSWLCPPFPEKAYYPSPSAETIAGFYLRFKERGGTVTFNLPIDLEGNVFKPDLERMVEVKTLVWTSVPPSRFGTIDHTWRMTL